MNSFYMFCITLVVIVMLCFVGIDTLNKRSHARALEFLVIEAECQERITKTRELQVIIEAKLDALKRGGMKEYLRVTKQLEDMEKK